MFLEETTNEDTHRLIAQVPGGLPGNAQPADLNPAPPCALRHVAAEGRPGSDQSPWIGAGESHTNSSRASGPSTRAEGCFDL
jgi:hypothetical protein